MSGGWFTVPRVDRDAIIAKLGSERAPAAMAVWLGLRDFANNKRSDTIQCSVREIARVAGTSYRTVERNLPLLRDIGLVRWEQTRLPETNSLGASIYHVLTLEPPATMAEPPADKAGPPAKDFGEGGGVLDRNTEKTGNTLREASPSADEFALDQEPSGTKTRKRNPLFDALAELDGNIDELTESGARAVGVALKQIRKVSPDVTPDEIRRRAGNLALRFHNVEPTSTSLAKHWARCDTPPGLRPTNGTPSAELTQARQDLAKLRSASAREKQATDYKTKLAQAETRVAHLEGRPA